MKYTYKAPNKDEDKLWFHTTFIKFNNNLVSMTDSASKAIFSLVVKKFKYDNGKKSITYFGDGDAYVHFDLQTKNVIYMMREQSDFNMQYRGCVIKKQSHKTIGK